MTVDDLFEPTINLDQMKGEAVGVIVTTSFDSGVNVTTSSSRNESGKTFYETSVKNGMFDGETQDYKTREEALAGHTKWVEHASKPIPIEIEELVDILSKAEDNGNLYRLAAHIILHGYVKTPVKVNAR
jgi:antitoxin component YwqK of YwqJK toxin-antitoxin module